MSAPIPHLPAPVRDARPAAPARGLSIWLAPPEAAGAFEVSKLNEADWRRWLSLSNEQRREDFAVSRALLGRVSPRANDVSSLSHSSGHAAICLGPAGCRVGVDVEWHRTRDVIAIARFAFDAEELAALEAAASPQREQLFYAMWVFKEAAAKALRLDLPDALRGCVLVPRPDGRTGVVPTDEPWAAWIYQPRPGLSLAAIQVGGAPEREPLCGEWTESTVSWPAVARAGSAYSPSASTCNEPGFFDNHRLAANCCPQHDGCITGSPQLRRSGPYRNAKPLSSLAKNRASKN
ncbi:MAG TPA: 4'-phosphopantetheinyl transferase superfamily protein [Povalibacter sp.]|nr:4'-phosphopantetheinyl transferase superfamily protein [Povalibacter sp.]